MSATEVISTLARAIELTTPGNKHRFVTEGLIEMSTGNESDGKTILDSEHSRLKVALPFHVNDEMLTLLSQATASLFVQERYHLAFEPHTRPAEVGFVYWDDANAFRLTFLPTIEGDPHAFRATEDGDVHPRAFIPVCGFSWGNAWCQRKALNAYDQHIIDGDPEESLAAVRFTYYAHRRDVERWINQFTDIYRGYYEKRAEELTEHVLETGRRIQAIRDSLGEVEDSEERRQLETELDADTRSIIELKQKVDSLPLEDIGSELGIPYDVIPVLSILWPRGSTEVRNVGADPHARYLSEIVTFSWTFFHISMQSVAVSTLERADRATRRRLAEMKLPEHITVVRLRRHSNPDPNREPGDTNWHHRWIVRGHWRMQACGVGRSERRPIWIHPFIKGPDGAPLIQSEKVYDLVR